MQTKALIPHRDIILKISRCSKKIITDFNKDNSPDFKAFPVFPFWVVSEKIPDDNFRVSICSPVFDGNDFYFPVNIGDSQSESPDTDFKIIFARIRKCGCESKSPDAEKLLKNCGTEFPLSVPCYKTGTALIENNSWKLFDEKWHKLSEKQNAISSPCRRGPLQ